MEGWEPRVLGGGEGEPLLLVHGVYAGASSFEFRKNFEELSKSFRVRPGSPGVRYVGEAFAALRA